MSARRVAVVGGGWAGLAAAVRATQAGDAVTLIDMAPQWGGRARSVSAAGLTLDNGQHILIGAYARTLDLMRTVGLDPEALTWRRPLELRYPDGRGLRSPGGHPVLGFARAVAGAVGWSWGDRWALLATAARWGLAGYRCAPELTVDGLCASLPPAVRQLLIDPLCVAALNTPATQASGAVFLRVLRDALFSGPGSADLLLPRQPLGQLLPEPAAMWLGRQGAELRLRCRAQQLQDVGGGHWQLDDERFDSVILACSMLETARLVEPFAPDWAATARALPYEPIVTVYLHAPGARLPAPMTALVEGPDAPAQFAFDHGAWGGTPGLLAFVVSGARAWVERGQSATASAVLHQARRDLPSTCLGAGTPEVVHVATEKRATFRCLPALRRPAAAIRPGLWAAGDGIAGPYPATLEGAVRSGEHAAAAVRG